MLPYTILVIWYLGFLHDIQIKLEQKWIIGQMQDVSTKKPEITQSISLRFFRQTKFSISTKIQDGSQNSKSLDFLQKLKE